MNIPKHSSPPRRLRTTIIIVLAAVAVAAGASIAIAASGGSQGHAAAPRACKVAALAVKDMTAGAVDGHAMGSYATALALAARQPSAVAGEARTASADALAAQQDVSNGDFVTYKTDSRRFISDLQILSGECKSLAGG